MKGSRAGGLGPNDRQPREQLRASRAAGLCLCGVILEMEVHGCLSVPCEAGHRGGKAEMSSGPLAHGCLARSPRDPAEPEENKTRGLPHPCSWAPSVSGTDTAALKCASELEVLPNNPWASPQA